ncbi:IS3 family transposase [Dubosiella newyorkensis]|uniref:IS3 family transposase n=1 Tax=Dubosiella newyorkensis TaxID=1862672 RepID=UPI003F67501D
MNRPSEKFELIYEIAQDPENTFSIKQLCELNHVSRSGYYSWIHSLEAKAAKEAQDRADFDLILQAFLEHGRKKGARQIYMVLQHMEPPVTFNLKKIRRLCRKYGLECPIRKANPYRRMAKAMRTDSVSDNLVERRFGTMSSLRTT